MSESPSFDELIGRLRRDDPEAARDVGGTPDALRVKLKRAVERVAGEMGLDDSRYD